MIIGLTGGIASGKTFCSDFFQSQNVVLVDADVIAREIVQIGSPVLAQLHQLLGEQVLCADGQLNRAWLREQIFADERIKQQVNALMHPAIRERAEYQLSVAQESASWVLYSVPLLFENGLDAECDAVIFVDILPTLQLHRAMMRDGVSEEQIRRIVAAQMPRLEKLRRAHYVIDNSGSKAQTLAQCEALFHYFNTLFSMRIL